MRVTSQSNGVTVKAYSGTTGVLLAMNIEEAKRLGLLGFAIERQPHKKGNSPWLINGLCFDGAGLEKPYYSNQAPIQKFRWSDYSVYPDVEYTYTVHPVYWKSQADGKPPELDIQEGPVIKIRTQSIHTGLHQVVFNRAVAASQAFANRFGEIKLNAESTDDILEKEKDKDKEGEMQTEDDKKKEQAALKWLSRGLLEKIISFIERAEDENWALDIAIYEYELKDILQAVEAAHRGKNGKKGARVRVVFHAAKKSEPKLKEGKKPDMEDEATKANYYSLNPEGGWSDNVLPPAEGLPPGILWRPRITNKIFHNKFIVLSKQENGRYTPQAVLCGSTNFTENGVYRQANVVHVVEDPVIAGEYEVIFEKVWNGENVKTYINKHNTFDKQKDVFAGFSPRSAPKKPKKPADLVEFGEIIKGAKRDILFCTAFDLDGSIEGALLGEPKDAILRFGLQNSSGSIRGVHADCTASFVTAALLPNGLEGWQQETTAGQRGNILIHTKMVITDFTSESPTVISGSHNLSVSASTGNDENYLIIRNNTDVADIYGCELMRLYDHYRFRYKVTRPAKTVQTAREALVAAEKELSKKPLDMAAQKAVDAAKEVLKLAQDAERQAKEEIKTALSLCPDDSWTEEYFIGFKGKSNPLKIRDRECFAGAEVTPYDDLLRITADDSANTVGRDSA